MSDTSSRPIETMDQWMRQVERDIHRLKRRPNPPDFTEMLGPGVSGQAVEVVDWNDDDNLNNGWYYSDPPARNAPVADQSFIGMTISKDDDSGYQLAFQFVVDPDVDTPELYVRTWVPDDDDGTPGFSEWFLWGDWFGGGGGAPVYFEENDGATVTSLHLANGGFILPLTHQPLPESLHLTVGGVPQSVSEFTVNVADSEVYVDIDSWVPSGTEVWTRYAYTDPVALDPIPFTVVGWYGGDTGGPATVSSLTMPAGAAVGDLAVVTLIGGFGGGELYQGPDSRFFEIASGTINSRQYGVYMGYLTTTANVPITLRGGSNAYGQFVGYDLTVLRGTGRKLYYRGWGTTGVTAGNSGIIPAITGTGSGAIAVVIATGGLGGSYGFDWTGVETPDYTEQHEITASYTTVSVGISTSNAAIPSQTNPTDDPDDSTTAVSIGLT